jgi:hypothetical protein
MDGIHWTCLLIGLLIGYEIAVYRKTGKFGM